jgi:hypothetical protein
MILIRNYLTATGHCFIPADAEIIKQAGSEPGNRTVTNSGLSPELTDKTGKKQDKKLGKCSKSRQNTISDSALPGPVKSFKN